MRPREKNGDLVLLVEVHHLLAGVVWSPIGHEDVILSPVGILLVQHRDEVRVVELHGPAVGVGLHQGDVHGAMVVQGGYHGHPGLHLLLGHR